MASPENTENSEEGGKTGRLKREREGEGKGTKTAEKRHEERKRDPTLLSLVSKRTVRHIAGARGF